jgi:hypothetical protein
MPVPAAAVPPSLFVWLGLLLGVVVLGGVIALVVRKRTFTDRAPDPGTFLDELRAARDRGELSQDEFDRVRAKFSARLRGNDPAAPPRPTPKPRPSGPDAGSRHGR